MTRVAQAFNTALKEREALLIEVSNMARARAEASWNTLDFPEWCEKYVQIEDKDTKKLIPFKLNKEQFQIWEEIKKDLQEHRPVRIIILKARQLGISTLVQAFMLWRSCRIQNYNGLIVSHKDDSTRAIFKKTKLMYELLPEDKRPEKATNTDRALRYKPPLRSNIVIASALGTEIGRSDTFLDVHVSEYGLYPSNARQIFGAIMQAVPSGDNSESVVIIESTAKGFNDFKDIWDMAEAGESEFVPIFFAWHTHSEYRRKCTREQIAVYDNNRVDPDKYSQIVYCIYERFKKGIKRNVMIGIENNLNPVVISRLKHWNIKQYKVENARGEPTKDLGWHTDNNSRAEIVTRLQAFVNNDVDKINDIATINQMLSYQKNDKGRPDHPEGEHDDLLIALGIALCLNDSRQHTHKVLDDYGDAVGEIVPLEWYSWANLVSGKLYYKGEKVTETLASQLIRNGIIKEPFKHSHDNYD